MAFYQSRRKPRPREDGEVGELNLVPYLDLLVSLVLAVLLCITGLTSFGSLDVSAPGYHVPGQQVAQEARQPGLVLSVLISKRGHYVTSENTILGQEPGAPTVPLKADGTYDYAALNAQMVKVKGAFPSETRVIVAADPDIPYEVLIQTMDALRETQDTPRRRLFPDILLGAF